MQSSPARPRVSLQRRWWISQSMMKFSAPASLSERVDSAAVRRSMETQNGRADDWLHCESSQSLVPIVLAALPVLAASLLLPTSAGPSPAASTAKKGITSTKRGQLCSLAQNPCLTRARPVRHCPPSATSSPNSKSDSSQRLAVVPCLGAVIATSLSARVFLYTQPPLAAIP